MAVAPSTAIDLRHKKTSSFLLIGLDAKSIINIFKPMRFVSSPITISILATPYIPRETLTHWPSYLVLY